MTLKTYYVDGDVYYGDSVNWVNGIIANNVNYWYNVDGTIGSIIETVAGGSIATRFVYSGANVGSIFEARDNKTITTVFAYDGANVSGVTRTVA